MIVDSAACELAVSYAPAMLEASHETPASLNYDRGQRALLSLAKLQVVGIAGKKVGREGGRIDQVLHRVVSRTVGSGHVWPTPAREAGSAAGVPGPLLQGPQAVGHVETVKETLLALTG